MTDGNSSFGKSDFSRFPDWDAFGRYLTGEATGEEAHQMEAALADTPADRDLIDALGDVISGAAASIPQDIDVEGALQRVKSRLHAAEGMTPEGGEPDRRDVIPLESRRRWRLPMPALAAAALLTVGVASWMAYSNRPQEQAAMVAPRMLATGVGVRDSIRLSDGTNVVLGPLSSLKMPGDYGERTRVIEVRGDAWFDVVHDTTRPFSVRAGNAIITDVGTKFAVSTDAAEGVAVTVSEGVVSLRQVNTPALDGVLLRAGDNGLLGLDGQASAQRGAANDDDIAWMKGRLVFRDASLGEVTSSMRKWYGLELRASDRALETRHLTATFAGESVDRVLEVIRLALGVEIERRGDTAIVRPAKASVRSR
jgi:transmembrane sensor